MNDIDRFPGLKNQLSHYYPLILLFCLWQAGCVNLLPKSLVREKFFSGHAVEASVQEAILQDRVEPGMRHAEVYMAWGKPDLVAFADGREVWHWQSGPNGQQQVVFDAQGRVREWQGVNPWSRASLFSYPADEVKPRGPRR